MCISIYVVQYIPTHIIYTYISIYIYIFMCDVQVVFWSVWPCCCFDNGARQKEQDTKDHGPGSWDHGAWQVVGGELGIFNRKKPIKPNDMKKCNFLKLERTLTNTRENERGAEAHILRKRRTVSSCRALSPVYTSLYFIRNGS